MLPFPDIRDCDRIVFLGGKNTGEEKKNILEISERNEKQVLQTALTAIMKMWVFNDAALFHVLRTVSRHISIIL
jgi:hypothetical protein